ncbi:MAG: ABC transporter ATP-binding protein [Saprospiraceae bacterium]
MKPVLEVNHVWKEYQKGIDRKYKSLRDTLTDIPAKLFVNEKEKFWALQDINFHVAAGESIGIIGRNGAGKSTLLKILSRITPPTKGEIILRGRVASLLEVGTGFHPELTGRENVFFNGSILGMKNAEIKRKFDEIVDFSGVESFIDTPLKHYSSGMQMRLAFSVAAHLDAEILLIDEVLAVGDAEFQRKCIGKMDEVSKGEGKTVVFVSHDMSKIKQLTQKSVYLNLGKLISFDLSNNIIDLFKKEFSYIINQLSSGAETSNFIFIQNTKIKNQKLFFELANLEVNEIYIMVGISNNDSQRIISKVSNLLKLKKNHIKGMVNLVETNQIFQADKYIVKFSILDNLFNLIESIEFFNVELISESKFFLGRKFYGDLVMANSYVEIHN